jgi:hypothetical protein
MSRRRQIAASSIRIREPSRPGHRRAPTRRRGVGLAEMLIALSISAALLTATAVAVDSAFKAYKVNQEQSDLTQRARLSIHRMTSLIRQTEVHAPYTPALATQFSTGKTVSDTGVNMYDLQGNQVTFRYDSANKRVLAVVTPPSSTAKSYPLCEGVESFSVKLEPMRSSKSIRSGGGWDLLRRVTILLTVKTNNSTALKGEGVGHQTVTISASVMPRRNNW